MEKNSRIWGPWDYKITVTILYVVSHNSGVINRSVVLSQGYASQLLLEAFLKFIFGVFF